MYRETPLETLMNWRSSIHSHLEEAKDRAEGLRTETVEDLADSIDDAVDYIDEAIAHLPCESGLVEFLDDAVPEDIHDDCYSFDDVALTHDDLDSRDTIEALELTRNSDLADLLSKVLMEPNAEVRVILTDIIDELQMPGGFSVTKSIERRKTEGREVIRNQVDARKFPDLSKWMRYELRNRVNKGAKVLDEYLPKWYDTLDPMRLDISNGETCVLGQLYPDIEAKRAVEHLSWATNYTSSLMQLRAAGVLDPDEPDVGSYHGFNILITDPLFTDLDYSGQVKLVQESMRFLQNEWIDHIYKRRTMASQGVRT